MLGNLRTTKKKKNPAHNTVDVSTRWKLAELFYFERGMWGDEADRQIGGWKRVGEKTLFHREGLTRESFRTLHSSALVSWHHHGNDDFGPASNQRYRELWGTYYLDILRSARVLVLYCTGKCSRCSLTRNFPRPCVGFHISRHLTWFLHDGSREGRKGNSNERIRSGRKVHIRPAFFYAVVLGNTHTDHAVC